MSGVAAIVPAYNEGDRVGRVLRAALAASLVTEVIAVSDGSSDGTARRASEVAGVTVIDLKRNVGKGGAMAAGVRATKASVVVFIDADLEGLGPEHVDAIVKPVVEGRADVCVGIFRDGKTWSDAAQRVSPFLSGQRAMRREVFEAVPYPDELRFGIEVALNTAARKRRARIVRVLLRGVSNAHKEQKMGMVKGTAARLRMYGEITQAMVKNRKRKRASSKRSRWL
ncbi:glycosyltransferase family 2 protein [bacterium]|nr:MAG: glycosyltransferase family 2 protein [bacterium]